MKKFLFALAFVAGTSHAYELSAIECQAATESTGQIAERRDQGYSLTDLKDNIEYWKASYERAEIADLLKDVADWVYADTERSPIELATRFLNTCKRSDGKFAALPSAKPVAASPDVFECMTIVDMSRLLKEDIRRGRTLDAVLVDIWSSQDDDTSLVAVGGLADLAKLMYSDHKVVPDAHAMKYLKGCLAKADQKTASAK